MKKIFPLLLLLLPLVSAYAQQRSSVGKQLIVADTFLTSSGNKLVLTPVKHGSLRITYRDVEIEVDPVTALPPATDYSAFPKADIILVTHEHGDHCDAKAVDALSKNGTRIFANAKSANLLGRVESRKPGDVVRCQADIVVEAVAAYNTTPEKQQFHPRGRDVGFVLTLGGFRFYIAGDTEIIPEMSALSQIDVALLPTNLPYTMTPEQTAAAARIIRPKVLFPYHFGDTKIERVAELLRGTDIDVRIRNYQ